jgi:CheY-like chemotaxis protein/glycine cleavage system H lipoate-binding protein
MAEKQKVLVVDDEPVIIESAKKVLGTEGFAVRAATDAETALDMLHAETPDLILIDLKLPNLSGMELLEIVQKEFPQIAAIVTTGYTTVDNAVESLQKGAFDFLPKPFSFDELLGIVQRACRFIALPAAARNAPVVTTMPNCYLLGMHVWAKPEVDGTAKLGVTDLFQQTVGRIMQIDLPAVNDEIRQGSALAQLVSEDQIKHTAWAALSGRIIQSNATLAQNPDLLNRDPWGDGWLVQIAPDNLASELVNLIHTRVEK